MTQTSVAMLPTNLNVLSVASEMYPLIKTGGLGDVVGSLPGALQPYGIKTHTLLPGYPAVMKTLAERRVVKQFENVLGHAVTVWEGEAKGRALFVADVPALYNRAGNPYGSPTGQDWPDNGIRYAVLSRVGAFIAQGCLEHWRPVVVQTHDWHAALVAAYLHYDDVKAPPVSHVIHNLAFQGIFPRSKLEEFGLPLHAFALEGLEFYGQISFLKAALLFANRLTAVSPTYAEEIQTPEHGMGFDGLLRARSVVLNGILNGLDLKEWDPMTDPAVTFPYAVGDNVGRRANKRVLQAEFGLPQNAETFLLGLVGRLTTQKGVDILAEIMPRLFEWNIQLIVVGVGDREIMRSLAELQSHFPHQLACYLNYSEKLGHKLHSAVDASLIPSRFEPCGLTQLHALRYGSVPIAARVGGLSDTIVDANSAAIAEGVANGILFAPTNSETLLTAVRRAYALFQQKSTWARLQRNGALHDVSWEGKAAGYAQLFRELAGYPPTYHSADDEIAPRRGDVWQRPLRTLRKIQSARMPLGGQKSLGAEGVKYTGTYA
ncbi:glycogen synthase [Acetobacter aceti 1023]|nr:glycogen synthase [Acetobacter aceti 1023]